MFWLACDEEIIRFKERLDPESPLDASTALIAARFILYAFECWYTAMDIVTTRFGIVTIDQDDVLTFVDGMIGMEDCQRWALLADAHNPALGWLQCLDRSEVALAVVSPRRFVADYRVRVARRDVEPLGLTSAADAQVLVIVNQVGDSLSLNLKAPLVIHVVQRIGRQIVAKDDHSVQHPLNGTLRLRRTA